MNKPTVIALAYIVIALGVHASTVSYIFQGEWATAATLYGSWFVSMFVLTGVYMFFAMRNPSLIERPSRVILD